MFLKYIRLIVVTQAIAGAVCIVAMQDMQQFDLDKTFGNEGVVITDFGMSSGTINKVIPSIHTKIQPDGKIIVVGDAFKLNGSSIKNCESAIALVRYLNDGLLDICFGKEGKVILPIATKSFGIDLALQNDDKIVVAGRIFDRDEFALGDAVVLRLNNNGSIDESFGQNGIARDRNEVLDWSNFFRVTICDDGGIIACGNKGAYGPEKDDVDHCSFYLKRFKKDGTLDETFGNGGYIEPILKVSNYTKSRVEGREADESYAVTIQTDGKIIAVGRIEDASQIYDVSNVTDSVDCAIMRFEKSGELDASFGLDKNGTVVTSVSKKSNFFVDCITQPDSKILALGVSRNLQTDKDEFLIVRYLDDGSLDHSFGDNGVVLNSIGDDHAHAKNIALQNDGKILVTGHAVWNGHKKFTIARYMSNGTPDVTFGSNNDGLLVTSLGDYDDRSFSLTLQDDDKLVVAGDSFDGTQSNFALVRYALQ